MWHWGPAGCCSIRCTCWVCGFCFFFQAEDGIRDVAVTGVQTCALPIWLSSLTWNISRTGTLVHGRQPANAVACCGDPTQPPGLLLNRRIGEYLNSPGNGKPGGAVSREPSGPYQPPQ